MSPSVPKPPPVPRVVAQTARRSAREVLQHLTPDEHAARGRAARKEIPRSSHSAWEPPSGRRSPVDLLERPSVGRVPELVQSATAACSYLRLRSSRRGRRHGVRPREYARFGPYRAAVRRRPPLKLRRVSLSAERRPDLRHQRLRRDAAGALGVGRQAAGRQLRDRGPRPDFSASSGRAVGASRPCARIAKPWLRSPRCVNWTSGTPRLDVDELLAASEQAGGPRRRPSVSSAMLPRPSTKDSMQAFSKLTHIVDGSPEDPQRPTAVVPLEELYLSSRRRSLRRSSEVAHPPPVPRTLLQYDRWVSSSSSELGRPGPQGCRRRQRRHASLDRSRAGPRRRRPAVPPGQGGPGRRCSRRFVGA